MSEKLSMNNKKRSWINQKEQEEESYPKTINFSARSFPLPLFPIMHPGGEVNFRKRGSKFSLPLSHRHQTLHVPLREVKFTKGGTHSSYYIPLPPSPSPFPSTTHTHTHTHAHTRAYTHAPNPWYTLEWKSSLQKGVYMLSSRAWFEGVDFGAGASL